MNPTYLVKAESGRYVLRAKPPGQLLKSAHMVDREYRVMKALAGSGVPVPNVLYLSGEDTPIGRMFYVMAFLDGRIFWDPVLPEILDNAGRAAIYDAMNATLAALHSLDIERVGLADFGKPGNYFERQFGRWTGQYRASATEPVPDMERLIGWLTDNMPRGDRQVSLVHGDFRLDDLIFAKDAPAVIACSTGNCRRSAIPSPTSPTSACNGGCRTDPSSAASAGLAASTARRSASVRARLCGALLRAARYRPSPDWTSYLAFSFFRFAYCPGPCRRALDGDASNPPKRRSSTAMW